MSYFIKDKFANFLLIISLFALILFGIKFQIKQYEADIQAKKIAEEAVAATKRALESVNPEHLRCLATNIYHEAGGEPFMGQVAVARVVMNRVKYGFASNPCKVVYQANTLVDPENPESTKRVCQFSWVCENKGTPPRNSVYIQAETIARHVLAENKWREDIPGNILFFHNNLVNPEWSYKRRLVIGNHIFYSKK